MAEKQKRVVYPTVISPVGKAAFAHLNAPDSKGTYADDKYKVTLSLDASDTEGTWKDGKGKTRTGGAVEFAKYINAHHAAAIKDKTKQNDSPVKEGKLNGNGDPVEEFVGKLLITGKSKYKPQLLAQNGKEMATAPKSGSEVRIAFALCPYSTAKGSGVSVQLRAVRLVKERAGADYSGEFGDLDGADASDVDASDLEAVNAQLNDEADGYGPDF